MTSYMTQPPSPKQEPVAVGEAVRLLVLALLLLLQEFDVTHFTDSQTAAVLGVYAAISVVVSVLVRRRVSPVGD